MAMLSQDTCGVVVTFHPAEDVVENLSRLKQEIDWVVVVDNGSSKEELALLRSVTCDLGFELIENGENLGIATALNLGIRRAEAQRSSWVFLFDQDSCVTPGFAQTMVEAFRRAPEPRKLGILIPHYVDKRSGRPMPAILEQDGMPQSAMTSGSLIPMSIFRVHGLFQDELFIDGVDHEFSLRLRMAGLHIRECPDALLLHSPGTPMMHRLIRKKPFFSSNYSPMRRYYQERNKIWVARKYWRRFPSICKQQFLVSWKELAKILLFEQDKTRKCFYFFRGTWDGFRGRMGRLE